MQKGYTIVEIISVIVVISILASIGFITYNGAQKRGYDSAIQSDLDSTAGLLESHRVNTSTTHQFPSTQADLTPLGIRATKNAYNVSTTTNFVYCVNTTGFQSFALVALSKSGVVLMMTQDGLKTNSFTQGDFSNATTICSTLGLALVSAGMSAPNTWQTWVGN